MSIQDCFREIRSSMDPPTEARRKRQRFELDELLPLVLAGSDDREKTDPIARNYVKQISQQGKAFEKESEEINRKRRKITQNQIDLWNVYKEGLVKISRLTHLRDAPDAVLPNNH